MPDRYTPAFIASNCEFDDDIDGIIPSEGVLAQVEESRLRDPSTHSVRSW